MGLDCLKVLILKKGWVSENYLGLCHVCKWYYLPLLSIEDDLYVEPNVDIKR